MEMNATALTQRARNEPHTASTAEPRSLPSSRRVAGLAAPPSAPRSRLHVVDESLTSTSTLHFGNRLKLILKRRTLPVCQRLDSARSRKAARKATEMAEPSEAEVEAEKKVTDRLATRATPRYFSTHRAPNSYANSHSADESKIRRTPQSEGIDGPQDARSGSERAQVRGAYPKHGLRYRQ